MDSDSADPMVEIWNLPDRPLGRLLLGEVPSTVSHQLSTTTPLGTLTHCRKKVNGSKMPEVNQLLR